VTRVAGDVIEAGAITLRSWAAPDAAFVFDACQDRDIQRWTTLPQPYTAMHAAEFVSSHARPQPEAGGAFFAVMATETGELLGSISIKGVRDGDGEIGYWLGPEARGRGAATQALDALATWSFRTFGLAQVHCRIAPGNAASVAVATRAGFVESGRQAGTCRDGDEPADALVFVRRAPAS